MNEGIKTPENSHDKLERHQKKSSLRKAALMAGSIAAAMSGAYGADIFIFEPQSDHKFGITYNINNTVGSGMSNILFGLGVAHLTETFKSRRQSKAKK